MGDDGKRSILITGCSSGIGYATAQVLAERGWRVFATCRKEEDCQRLTDEGLTSFRLDYEDPPSIATGFSRCLEETGGRLDALFNNGAYGIPSTVEDLPVEALPTLVIALALATVVLAVRLFPILQTRLDAEPPADA